MGTAWRPVGGRQDLCVDSVERMAIEPADRDQPHVMERILEEQLVSRGVADEAHLLRTSRISCGKEDKGEPYRDQTFHDRTRAPALLSTTCRLQVRLSRLL
jgi:hypothetical protein